MTRIIIPVFPADSKLRGRQLALTIVSVFIFGMLLGAFTANIPGLVDLDREGQLAGIGATFSFGSQDTTLQIPQSAVVNADLLLTPLIDANGDFSSESTEEEGYVTSALSGEVLGAEAAVSIPERTEAELKDARDRLVREIQLLKETSISLIALFRQNCGVWNDDCALPYSEQLEKYNARYLELERQLQGF